MNRLTELDELIAAGWGNTPGLKIPRNWRELNAEAWGTPEQLLAEVAMTSMEASIPLAAIEVDRDLVWRVMQNERARRKSSGFGRHRRFFDRPAIQKRAEWLREAAKRVG